MKDETRLWLQYAEENLDVAELALTNGHFNASLHNAHQAVEKYLKAVIIENDLPFKKTHGIYTLRQTLADHGMQATLSEEECDLFDVLYMPSRYPLFSVLPDAMADRETCERCIKIARNVKESVQSILGER